MLLLEMKIGEGPSCTRNKQFRASLITLINIRLKRLKAKKGRNTLQSISYQRYIRNMTGTKQEPSGLDCDSQYEQSEKSPETEMPSTRTVNEQDSGVEKGRSVFTEIMRLMTELCPWLTSTDELKKSLHKAAASIKERPMTSILCGLTLGFGFIPFVGFILLICGSFAFLITWFMFCQFLAVLISALLCTGVFWIMLISFAALAVLLGGAVHTFMLWGILANHAGKLVGKLSTFILQPIGLPEPDPPRSTGLHKNSGL
ncbi:hypothetical protein RRG08_044634 [Elysia crispata]|uniref:Uncharacterized protein n=1 Tax=Elysia crispata TaxID=231223 RepID=A0AAE1D127_9GAST|nr:hypothetical protein RRG08_044634 [Elysia crispata]